MQLHEFFYHLAKTKSQILDASPDYHLHNDLSKLRRSATLQGINIIDLIDTFKESTFGETATASLAEKKQLQGVNYLYLRGANASFIGYGFAIGGHQIEAEKMRDLGADIRWLALGAAQNGSYEYTEQLRKLGANINWIMFGLGQAKNISHEDEYLNYLLAEGGNANWLIFGAGLASNRELIYQLTTHEHINLNYAALGAACGGHLRFALDLVTHGAAHIDWVVFGAALGGNLKILQGKINRPHRPYFKINMPLVVIGSTLGGHLYEVDHEDSKIKLFSYRTCWQQLTPDINIIIQQAKALRLEGPEAISAILGNTPSHRHDYIARLNDCYNQLMLAERITQGVTTEERNHDSMIMPYKLSEISAMLRQGGCI